MGILSKAMFCNFYMMYPGQETDYNIIAFNQFHQFSCVVYIEGNSDTVFIPFNQCFCFLEGGNSYPKIFVTK